MNIDKEIEQIEEAIAILSTPLGNIRGINKDELFKTVLWALKELKIAREANESHRSLYGTLVVENNHLQSLVDTQDAVIENQRKLINKLKGK